ncbi:hypothetical protein QBC42DRAFT_332298 [Cladorrhinum samala]|uniref:Uncharacterized protein n=1 Tax=Cladorrhinum samala TaxID=585594 RepID=A0AAV9HKC2_9PEZI|nr:hypothetical protein QBC42DRAFT_332298 [Cladorrhinum samala]
MFLLSHFTALILLPLVASLSSSIPSIIDRQAPWNNLAQFNWDPFVVTNLSMTCQRPNSTVNYTCDFDFAFFDPNSVRENNVTSTSCHRTWSWDGVYRSGSIVDFLAPPVSQGLCWWDSEDGSYFDASVTQFWHPQNFTLQLGHRYHDDQNFTIPWDWPITHAATGVYMQLRTDFDEGKDGSLQKQMDKLCFADSGPLDAVVFEVLD